MQQVANVFFVSGLIIMIGFFGNFLFQKTRISDVVILLGIGILLGPVFHWISPNQLAPIAPYFGALALMLILFEGGLDLDFDRVVKQFGPALVLSLLSFTATAAAIGAFMHYFEGESWYHGLLLGSILGCTSGSIVIPLASRMGLAEDAKTVLNMESALSDVWGVIATVVILRLIINPGFEPGEAMHAVAGAFSIAAMLAVGAGLVWLFILRRMEDQPLSYMMTLAALFMLYSITEFIHASGPMAALIFGIVLANSDKFAAIFNLEGRFTINETLKHFHGEVSFVVRTFFFVYLGVVIAVQRLSWDFILTLVFIFFTIILVRYISVALMGLVFPSKRPNRFLYWSMIPRGLTNAVLATLPLTFGVAFTDHYLSYAFYVILLTNIMLTVWTMFLKPATADGGEADTASNMS